MADEPMLLFLATYDAEADARLDCEAVKELHSLGVIGTHDAAVITKDADGKVKVSKHEKPTEHGAWTGVAVGAVVGILFPRRSRNHRQRAQAGREARQVREPSGTPRAAAGRRPPLSGKARS